MATTFKKLKEFPLGWRFTDERYNLIEEIHLLDFSIFDEKKSKKIWKTLTNSNKYHIAQLDTSFLKDLKKIGNYCLDKDYSEGIEILNKINVLDKDDRITVFWGGKNSIEVSWKTFVLYWDDFCYPSDDNLIVCKEKNVFIVFQDEFISLYKLD
ncbi:hypothetical protein A8C32_01735 [Flavivirga aquatica]|uniref:DUF2947 domain-containing protein n=1 Tax=Flavivirga aquatica TaxID=1849968 RepID=A0A1E5TA23_9FLAO|nr:DUF2947 family protein [Flavivirga aquatica]OEK08211.1 hypothetical protein A8C32_01735 [Flavivirga aquatica]